jgi:hypothetical protein
MMKQLLEFTIFEGVKKKDMEHILGQAIVCKQFEK